MSNGIFYEIHDDGKAASWSCHCHGHLSCRPAADLLHDDCRAQSWAVHGHGLLISRPAADLLHGEGNLSPCLPNTSTFKSKKEAKPHV